MRDMSPRDPKARQHPLPAARNDATDDLDRLLVLVARGDERAFEAVYDRLAGPAYGVARGQSAVLYDGETVVGSGVITGSV